MLETYNDFVNILEKIVLVNFCIFVSMYAYEYFIKRQCIL